MIRQAALLIGILGFAIAAAGPANAAAASDPPVPAGLDPGGIAIGLVTTGLDTTDAEIAGRLARDGEGHPIAWDAASEDANPYAPPGAGHGTAAAKALLGAYAKSRLVAVRSDPARPQSFVAALGFAIRTPAKLLAVTSLPSSDGGRIVAQAAAHAPHILFFVPAGEGFAAVPDNVVRVAPVEAAGTIAHSAVDAWISAPGRSLFGDLAGRGAAAGDEPARALAVARAAGNAACAQHAGEAATAAEAKAKFLALARPSRERPGLMVHDPLCWYGGVVHGR